MPLTRAQAREFDRRASDEFGVPSVVLMENAGRGVAVQMRKYNPKKRRVIICCGGGNNGGDGFVLARHLDNFGWPVKILLFAEPAKLSADAAIMFEIAKRSLLPIHTVPLNDNRIEDELDNELTTFDGWIVDALFGTGLDGPVREPFDRVIAAINASPAPVMSIDIPSGLDCDTGQPLGVTVRANVTPTFIDLKEGFLYLEAQPWLGEVHVTDIGAPRTLVEQYVPRDRTAGNQFI